MEGGWETRGNEERGEDEERGQGRRAGQGRVRAQVDPAEAPTHRIHLWPDLVAAGTSRKDHRSLRHFSPSCHEAAAKQGRPGVFRTAEQERGESA